MAQTQDEFRFLPGDARFWGLEGPLPEVARVQAQGSDGAQLSAIRYGSEPPQLSFLHGAGLNAHSFDATILALGRPALSLDLPGHGHSDWREDADYAPDAIAPAVAEALAALTPGRQLLVGQSLGALSAAVVAGAHPELARALVMIDITPGIRPQRDASAVRDFLAGPRDFADVEEVVDRAIAFGIGTDRSLLRRGVELNTRVRPDGRIEFRHHLAHLDEPVGLTAERVQPIWAALEGFEGPILLVAASAGILGPELVQEFGRRLPQARIVTIEALHNVQEGAPLELARAIAALDD